MLTLARKHLQQHVQLTTSTSSSSTSSAAAPSKSGSAKSVAPSTASRSVKREDLLADFPLAPITTAAPSSKKTPGSKLKAPSTSVARTNRSPGFRKTGLSTSAIKRAKALQKKLPRPTLLEQAERSLTKVDTGDMKRKNLSMLTHTSERKKQVQEAMKQILLLTTPKSRHAQEEEKDETMDDERDDFDDAELDEFID